LHIPKNAGSTLNEIIERQYPLKSICSIYPDNAKVPGGIVLSSADELGYLDKADLVDTRLLRTHLSFGIHTFLPIPSVYFTVLRDPVERTISLYYFILSLPQSLRPDYFPSEHISLQECLRDKITIEMDNAQTRMLAGDLHTVQFGQCTDDDLERAKRNLREHFAVVGLTERFDGTLLLLRKALGWQNSIHYRRLNVTKYRPRADELSTKTLEAIAQANRLDIELYQYAETLFQETIRRQGPLFALRLRAFQLLNRRRRHVDHPENQPRPGKITRS
jgi:hypothetical protein